MWLTATAFTLAMGAAVTLLAAGVGHALRPRTLVSALHAQRLWPARWRPAVAGATIAAEPLAGATVIVSGALGLSTVRAALVGQAALLAGLAGYQVLLRVRRPAAPCGCFGAGRPASWSGVAGTATLAAASAVAGGGTTAPHWPVAWRLLAVAAGGVLVLGVWTARLVAGPDHHHEGVRP